MPETVNYPLIADVLQSIRNNPKHHDQTAWVGAKANTNAEINQFVISHKVIKGQDLLVAEGSCETSACIAGWALLLEGYDAFSPVDVQHARRADTYYEKFSSPEGPIVDRFSVSGEAAYLLRIHEGADQIFMDMDNKRAVAQLMFVFEKGRLPELDVYDEEDEFVADFDPSYDMECYDRYVFNGQESDEFRDEWYARFEETFPYSPPLEEDHPGPSVLQGE